ncbi:hypothetical protein [Candidatus Poriferisodalis sp.]|uniref:hypothetical protein n=1 Tax=Candidatus Poriferisodalis sp. TaxID=3101277 RepID=UPI003B025A9D
MRFRQRAALASIAVSVVFIAVGLVAGWGLLSFGGWIVLVAGIFVSVRDLISRPQDAAKLAKGLRWANTTIAGFAMYVVFIVVLLAIAFRLG